MLELKNIAWKTPTGEEILKDISLIVPDGKLMVITGPNGGGKTTLAKIISGIYTQSSGNIILDGKDITNLDVTQRANEGISFAFQQPVRFKGITVRKLIELSNGGKLSEDKMCAVLSKVGLCAREYIDREINSTLSGGEIKRIEIASVLARHTKLSVFDEPEAGIDLWSFTNLIEVFKEIRHNLKGTLVIISHQERILQIADEIAVIADGHVKQVGPKEQMFGNLFNGKDIFSACSRQEAMFK